MLWGICENFLTKTLDKTNSWKFSPSKIICYTVCIFGKYVLPKSLEMINIIVVLINASSLDQNFVIKVYNLSTLNKATLTK